MTPDGTPGHRPLQWGIRSRQATMLLVVVAFLSTAYVVGAVRHSHAVNHDVSLTDQRAYLNYGRNLSETTYGFTDAHLGNRNRMPLYPILLSLVYASGLDEEEYFVRAKRLNIALSLFVLAGVWLMARGYHRPPAATQARS